MKVIDDARKNSAKDSAYGYVEAVEYGIVASIAKTPEVNYNGEFTVEDGKIVQGSIEISVKYKGSPLTGTVQIENNKVVSANFMKGSYSLVYDGTNVTVEDSGEVVTTLYTDGTAVYFNPYTGKTCKEKDATIGRNGQCMKWYIFGDSNEVSIAKMILDHNFTNSEWVSKEDYVASGGTVGEYGSRGNNKYGPVTIMNTLKK